MDRTIQTKRTGNIIVLMALLLSALAGMGAFAIDIGYIEYSRTQLQCGADSAALAAVEQLSESQAALDAVALQYVTHNVQTGSDLSVTVAPGQWDDGTATFTSSTLAEANALKVTAVHRDLSLFFGPVLGKWQTDVTASAVAVVEGDCFDKGVTAGDTVTMGQDVRQSNYCIYGRNGVRYGQDPVVINGAKTGALDTATVTYGQNPTGLPENIVKADKQPTIANNMVQILDNLEAGWNLPPQITRVEYYPTGSRLPNNLQSGTAYVFAESISIGQDYTASDVIIATRKNISFGQDGAIRNSGSAASSDYAIGLYAGDTISIGQDATVLGVNIAAGKDVNIGQDLRGFEATIQAARKIVIGQDPNFDGGWQASISSTSGGAGALLVQ